VLRWPAEHVEFKVYTLQYCFFMNVVLYYSFVYSCSGNITNVSQTVVLKKFLIHTTGSIIPHQRSINILFHEEEAIRYRSSATSHSRTSKHLLVLE